MDIQDDESSKISPINARKRLIYEKILTKIAGLSARILGI